jgi:S-adenosylhomocysteine hydrolase
MKKNTHKNSIGTDEIEYEKLRMDVLEKLIEERDIKYPKNKSEMIKYLKLDDQGKYIRETLYEKYDKDTYFIGIDPLNTSDLIVIGKLIEKGEVKQLALFQNNRIYFETDKKIEL